VKHGEEFVILQNDAPLDDGVCYEA